MAPIAKIGGNVRAGLKHACGDSSQDQVRGGRKSNRTSADHGDREIIVHCSCPFHHSRIFELTGKKKRSCSVRLARPLLHAAFLRKIADESLHDWVIGSADKRSRLAFLRDEINLD